MCDISFSGTIDTLKMHLKIVHKKSEPKLEPIEKSEKEPITFVSVSESLDTFSESEFIETLESEIKIENEGAAHS